MNKRSLSGRLAVGLLVISLLSGCANKIFDRPIKIEVRAGHHSYVHDRYVSLQLIEEIDRRSITADVTEKGNIITIKITGYGSYDNPGYENLILPGGNKVPGYARMEPNREAWFTHEIVSDAGEYEIRIIRNGVIDTYNLSIANEEVILKPVETHFSTSESDVVLRFPANHMLVQCNYAEADNCETFFADVEKTGAIRSTSGYAKLREKQNSYEQIRLYSYTGDFFVFEPVVAAYVNLDVQLENTNGYTIAPDALQIVGLPVSAASFALTDGDLMQRELFDGKVRMALPNSWNQLGGKNGLIGKEKYAFRTVDGNRIYIQMLSVYEYNYYNNRNRTDNEIELEETDIQIGDRTWTQRRITKSDTTDIKFPELATKYDEGDMLIIGLAINEDGYEEQLIDLAEQISF